MSCRLQHVLLMAVFCVLAGALSAGGGKPAHAAGGERAISLYNIHTKETLSIVFKRDGRFVPDALAKFNHFMRDWRRNVSTEMDPALLDLIWEMHSELGSQKPVFIISGFRSGTTNEKLRRAGGGQAKNSRHVSGEAADIHFPDVSVKQLRNSALVRERGGVGYYPTSAIPFVHVDTGNVRHWPKLPRQELAILFPSGKSRHVPSDGKPLTKQDFRFALAKLESSGGALPIAVQRILNKPAKPVPMLASLGPTKLPLGFGRGGETAPASPAPSASLAPVAPKLSTAVPGAPLPAARLDTPKPPLTPLSGPDYSPGFVTAALRLPRKDLSEDQIARAPDYDDDHPEESNYQPFAIAPLLSDTPLAYTDFSKLPDGLARKSKMLFGDMSESLVIEFEPGPQYEGMFWAQRFTGKAVNGAMTKFVPNEAVTSTVMKTASGWRR